MAADKIEPVSDTPPRVARPRGRPRKNADFVPTDGHGRGHRGLSVHGYNPKIDAASGCSAG